MAAAKRYSPEQIVAKLREAEKMQGQGATIAQVRKKLGCAEQTFYWWRRQYGAMKEDEAIRLKTWEFGMATTHRKALLFLSVVWTVAVIALSVALHRLVLLALMGLLALILYPFRKR